MSFDSILGNLIAAVIYAALAYLAKVIWKGIMKSERENSAIKRGKKTTLRKQFFVSLLVLLISLVVFCSIGPRQNIDALGVIKIFSGIFAGFSFLITWGAFDTAFAFYPDDDVISKPSDQDSANDTR